MPDVPFKVLLPYKHRSCPLARGIGVYSICNIINGDVYIGSTSIGFYERFTEHRSDLNRNRHRNIILQRAWRKYGEDAFVFDVVEECKDTLKREQFWIDFLKPEYNIAKFAASSFKGRKHSKETREKMSLAKLGVKPSASAIEARRAGMLKSGYRISKEQREKMKAGVAKMSEERKKKWRERLSSSHVGYMPTEETRKRLSEAAKVFWIKRKEKYGCTP